MMDVDFVRKCYEEQSEPFDKTCNEMIEHRDQMDSAQLQTAEDLKKLREQFEESQREQNVKDIEQAKENRSNRWITIASLLLSAVSTACAVLALILQILG